MIPKLHWHWNQPYQESLKWQQNRRTLVQQDPANRAILLCEHPPTITLGKRGGTIHHHRQDTTIEQLHRGGLATWHGPGQLAFYPIMPIQHDGIGIKRYVCVLEKCIIRVLQTFQIDAHHGESPGIWVQHKKIASIGLDVRSGVAIHGIAINVQTDLTRFQDLICCGDPQLQFTSMQQEINTRVPLLNVGHACIHEFMKAYHDARRG